MWLTFVLLSLIARPREDHNFQSQVFGEQRHYRLFLPADYEHGSRRYPVIYYFHGHSDRYTLERYDNGKDTVPKIARFVAENGVIVVAVDGYVAGHYTGFYGGTPYDLLRDGGTYDFGEHFKELVAHIDGSLRTIADRRHRATSGLSMGGFMSLYLSARYPDLIGSASAFNPGHAFFSGEKGRRSLWRLKDHLMNHAATQIRLVRSSGDYISQYHEELRAAYASTNTIATGRPPSERPLSFTSGPSPTRRSIQLRRNGVTPARTAPSMCEATTSGDQVSSEPRIQRRPCMMGAN